MPKPQSQIIRWEAPPPSKRIKTPAAVKSHSKYDQIAADMRARPGEWAVVYEGAQNSGSGLATHIRMGQQRCFSPAGDFDALTRTIDGSTTVYARLPRRRAR